MPHDIRPGQFVRFKINETDQDFIFEVYEVSPKERRAGIKHLDGRYVGSYKYDELTPLTWAAIEIRLRKALNEAKLFADALNYAPRP